MEFFLYYLLRASVLMALFYLLYKFFFANNTFHTVNRFSLIFMLLMISVLPVFRFNLIPEKQQEPIPDTFWMDLSSIPITEYVEVQQRVEIPWMQILMTLFFVGFLLTVIRYLIGLMQIAVIIRKSEKQKMDDDTVLCITERNISPFSWMKYIVLSRKDLSVDNQVVIRHEKAHIHLRHSFDMILFDIFTCFFWFNPFSWLLRREIQSVHEYQADEQVLNHGIDSRKYQLLLIRKSVGDYKFALANNFHQRDLLKRITMMKKDKTNRRMKWNYAMILPVLFLAMIALSVPKLNAKVVEKDNIKMDVDQIADDQSKVIITGTVKDRQGIIVGGTVTIKGTNRGTITDMEGKFSIKTDVGSTLRFSMIGYKTVEYKVESNKKNNLEILLEPDDNGKEVVQPTAESSQNALRVVGEKRMDNSQDVVERVVINTAGENQPLYILDGTIISGIELQKIKPENIESISVLKDKSAIDMYGDDAKNGAVLITLKKSNSDVISVGAGSMESLRGDVENLIEKLKKHSAEVSDQVSEETDLQSLTQPLEYSPLIIIDGEEMPKDFKMDSIDPNGIESISVLKDKTAMGIYGDDAKNGAILIIMKK